MLQRADSCSQEPDEPEPSQSNSSGQPQTPQWCKCGRCRHMDNPVERVCCKMRMCVTTTETFQDVVLNRNVLLVCIIDHGDYMGEDATYTPASYRKAGYRQYILYSHGFLGKGNRKIVPSCVLWKVRDHYPASDNVYLGFRHHDYVH